MKGPAEKTRGDIWVFAYGSLMWRPNFPYLDCQPALLYGYHRALCIHSIRYRGTPDCTGLVVGLDHGGSCRGRAYKIDPADAESTLDYLWRRELDTDSYVAKRLTLSLPKGRVTAWAFVANHANETQYAGNLTPDEAARRVARGLRRHFRRAPRIHLRRRGFGDFGQGCRLGRRVRSRFAPGARLRLQFFKQIIHRTAPFP